VTGTLPAGIAQGQAQGKSQWCGETEAVLVQTIEVRFLDRLFPV
jgi:hypothetical protein